jgi:nickel/cobalt transporter (NicO) family protein
MQHDIIMLILAAIPVGFLHTLMGPDHYVPFIAMAKARNWTLPKTTLITTLCGIGHVLSAAILGIIGIGLNITFSKFSFIETWRGEIAAWLLISFGLLYCAWGIRSAIKNKQHSHKHTHFFHKHVDLNVSYEHEHKHNHSGEHFHPHTHNCTHANKNLTNNHQHNKKELTPWILFIVFILGPCEPLIPLMMYPAIKGTMLYVVLVSLGFGIATIATMLLAVFTSLYGVHFIKLNFWQRYGSITAGAIICCLGLSIKFLGI